MPLGRLARRRGFANYLGPASLGRPYALQRFETNMYIIENCRVIVGKYDGFFIRNPEPQAGRLSWRRLRRVIKDKYRNPEGALRAR